MSEAGERLKALLAKGCVTAPGAYDGLSARLAALSGADAVYMTGFGVAGSLLGKPDIGLVSASEMMGRVCVMAEAASPAILIADGDNGHGGVLNVAELTRAYEASGAAAIQLEDQMIPKRCGHMEGKELVPVAEAAAKIRAACAARRSPAFHIIARTDARAVEGFEAALERARAYRKAGADIIFVEAPRGIDELRAIVSAFPGVPLMANMVEDGKTPMLSFGQLAALGYRLVIFPISALLRAAQVLAETYAEIRAQGYPDEKAPRFTFDGYNAALRLPEMLAQAKRFERE